MRSSPLAKLVHNNLVGCLLVFLAITYLRFRMSKRSNLSHKYIVDFIKEVKSSEYFICISILLVSALIYLSNRVTISSGDSTPNTLLALNFLENHTLHFDNFRNSYFGEIGYGYAFRESVTGHLTSGYPIGTAILTFPIYLILFIYLKLAQIPFELTAISFEPLRLLFEKIAATSITSLSIVLFYIISRLGFSRCISLLTTLIYAFATNAWVTGSQGLWQHGSTNLALLIVILCFLLANRFPGRQKIILLIVAGIFAGLLPGIRPTNVLFLISSIIYAIFTYKGRSLFFVIGLISMSISIYWNLYYFGNLTGGYTGIFSSYILTFQNFFNTSLGVLISPSRGLFVYSPIVLFAFPGIYQIYRQRGNRDAQLIICMTFASVFLLLSYCFVPFWWAGSSYGPRFMTDIMPVACYLINYFLKESFKSRTFIRHRAIFIACLLISIYTQAVGAFGFEGAGSWNGVPISVDQRQYRLWQVQDSQIIRHTQAVLNNYFIDLPTKKPNYLQSLSGYIQEVREVEKLDGKHTTSKPLLLPLIVQPGSGKLLEVTVKNTGASKWFGYQSALKAGEIRVATKFFDNRNLLVSESRLFISGTVGPQEETTAIGFITFPTEPGNYRLSLELIAEGLGGFSPSPALVPFKLPIQIARS